MNKHCKNYYRHPLPPMSTAHRKHKASVGSDTEPDVTPPHSGSRRVSRHGQSQLPPADHNVGVGNSSAQASPNRQTATGPSHAHALAALERRCLIMISLAEKEAARRHTQLLQRVRELEETVAEKDTLIATLVGNSDEQPEAESATAPSVFSVLKASESSLRLFSNNLASAKSTFTAVHGDVTARLALLSDQRTDMEGRILMRFAESLQLYTQYGRYVQRSRLATNISQLLFELGTMHLNQVSRSTERRRLERAIRLAERDGNGITLLNPSEAGDAHKDPMNDSTSSENDTVADITSTDNKESRTLDAILKRYSALAEERQGSEELDFATFVTLMGGTSNQVIARLEERADAARRNLRGDISVTLESDEMRTEEEYGINGRDLSILSPLSRKVVPLQPIAYQGRQSPNRSLKSVGGKFEGSNIEPAGSSFPNTSRHPSPPESRAQTKLALFRDRDPHQGDVEQLSELDAEIILSLMGKRQFDHPSHLGIGSWLLRPLPNNNNGSSNSGPIVPNQRLMAFLAASVNRSTGESNGFEAGISLSAQPILMYLCGASDLLQRYSDEITAAHTAERRKLRALQQNFLLRPERMWLRDRAEDLCYREMPKLDISTQALANVFLNQIARTAEDRSAKQIEMFAESNAQLHSKVANEINESALPKHHSALVDMVTDGLYMSPSHYLSALESAIDMPAKGWWALSWRQVLTSAATELFDPSGAYLSLKRGDKAGKSRLFSLLDSTKRQLQRELDEFAVWINATTGNGMSPRVAIQMAGLDLNLVMNARTEGPHPIITSTLDKHGLSFTTRQLLLRLKQEDVARRLAKALSHIWRTFHEEAQTGGAEGGDYLGPLSRLKGPALILQKNSSVWTILKTASLTRFHRDRVNETADRYASSSGSDDSDDGADIGKQSPNKGNASDDGSVDGSDGWDLMDDFSDWVRLDGDQASTSSWRYRTTAKPLPTDALVTLSGSHTTDGTIRPTDITSPNSAARANEWTHAIDEEPLDKLPIIISHISRTDRVRIRKGRKGSKSGAADPFSHGAAEVPLEMASSYELVRRIVQLFSQSYLPSTDTSADGMANASIASLYNRWELLHSHQQRELTRFNPLRQDDPSGVKASWTVRIISKAFPLLSTKASEVDDDLYSKHEDGATAVINDSLTPPKRLQSAAEAILGSSQARSSVLSAESDAQAAYSMLSYASPLRRRPNQSTNPEFSSPLSSDSSPLRPARLVSPEPLLSSRSTSKGMQWHNLMEVSNVVTVSTNLTYASMTAEDSKAPHTVPATPDDVPSPMPIGAILTPIMVESVLLSADAAHVEYSDQRLSGNTGATRNANARVSTLHFGPGSGDEGHLTPPVGSWHSLRYAPVPPGIAQRKALAGSPYIQSQTTCAGGLPHVPILRTPLMEASSPYGGLIDIREQRFMGPYSHVVRQNAHSDSVTSAFLVGSSVKPHFDSSHQQPTVHGTSATVVYVNTILSPPLHQLKIAATAQHAVTIPDRLVSGLLMKALGDYNTLSAQFTSLLCALEWRIRERYFFTGYEEDEDGEIGTTDDEGRGGLGDTARETTVRNLDRMIRAAELNSGHNHPSESSDEGDVSDRIREEESLLAAVSERGSTAVFNDGTFDGDQHEIDPEPRHPPVPHPRPTQSKKRKSVQKKIHERPDAPPLPALSPEQLNIIFPEATHQKLRGKSRRQMAARILGTRKTVMPIVVVNFSLATLRQEAKRVDYLRRNFADQINREKLLNQVAERTWVDKESELVTHIEQLRFELEEARQTNANLHQELTSLLDQQRNREELQCKLELLPEKLVDVRYSVTQNTFGEGWQESIVNMYQTIQDQCAAENQRLLSKVKFWVQDNLHSNVADHTAERSEARIAAVIKSFSDDQKNQFEIAKRRIAFEKKRGEDELHERIAAVEEKARLMVEESSVRHEEALRYKLSEMEELYSIKVRAMEARQLDKEAELSGKLQSLRTKYRDKENVLTAKMDDLRATTHNELEERLAFHRDEFATVNRQRDDELMQCKRDHETVQRNLRNFYNSHFLEMCGNLQDLVIGSRQELQEIFFVDRWENMRQSMVLFSQIQRTAEDAKQKHYREVVIDTYVKGLSTLQDSFTRELSSVEARYQVEISQREITHVKHFDEFRVQREDHLRSTAETRAQQNQAFWSQCQQTLMNAERYMAQYRAEVDVTFQRRRQNLVASCQEYLEKDVAAARKSFEAELNLRREQLHNSIVQYHRLDIKQLQLAWEEVGSRALVEKTFLTSLHSLRLQETNECETRRLMEHNLMNAGMVDRYQWGAMKVGEDDESEDGDDTEDNDGTSKRAKSVNDDTSSGESPGPVTDDDKEAASQDPRPFDVNGSEAEDSAPKAKKVKAKKKKGSRIVFGRLTALPSQSSAPHGGPESGVGMGRSGSVIEHSSNASHRITELFIPRSDLVSMRTKYENRLISIEREKEQLCRDFLSAMQSQVQLSKQDVSRQHHLASSRAEVIAEHLKDQFAFVIRNNNFMVESRLESIASEAENYLLSVDKEIDSDGEVEAPSLMLGLSKVHNRLVAAEKGLLTSEIHKRTPAVKPLASPIGRRASSASPVRTGGASRQTGLLSPGARANTPPASSRSVLGQSPLTNRTPSKLAGQSRLSEKEKTLDIMYDTYAEAPEVGKLQDAIKGLKAQVRQLNHQAKYKRSLTELLSLLFGDGARNIRKSDSIEERILFYDEREEELARQGTDGRAMSSTDDENDDDVFTVVTNDDNSTRRNARSGTPASFARTSLVPDQSEASLAESTSQSAVVAKAHKALSALIMAPIAMEGKSKNSNSTQSNNSSPKRRVLKAQKGPRSRRMYCGNAAITIGYYLTMKQRMHALMEAFTTTMAAYADDNGRRQATLLQGIHQQYVLASGNLLSKIEGYSAMTANKAQLANHLATRIELAMEEVRVSEFTCSSLRSALREFATFNQNRNPTTMQEGDKGSAGKSGNKSMMITLPKASVAEMTSMRERNFVHEYLLQNRQQRPKGHAFVVESME